RMVLVNSILGNGVISDGNNRDVEIEKVDFNNYSLWYLDSKFQGKSNSTFATQIMTNVNLKGKWGENDKPYKYLQFEVMGRHSLSGFTKSFKMEYKFHDLKKGKFISGNSMEIDTHK
ncbi:MAG: hypothetical protein AAGA10_22380, partial [Bacteroidota bacterium]